MIPRLAFFARGFADEIVPPLGDVLWQHSDGTVAIAARELGSVPTNWEVEGTGDFDADADGDILWRHDDGSVVTWHVEDGALAQTQSFGQVPNAWQIQGTGEFDLV